MEPHFSRAGERWGQWGKSTREGCPYNLGHSVFGKRQGRALRAQSKIKSQKSVGPFEVLAFGGVNADDFTFVNEGRNLYHDAGFKLSGFGHVGG